MSLGETDDFSSPESELDRLDELQALDELQRRREFEAKVVIPARKPLGEGDDDEDDNNNNNNNEDDEFSEHAKGGDPPTGVARVTRQMSKLQVSR